MNANIILYSRKRYYTRESFPQFLHNKGPVIIYGRGGIGFKWIMIDRLWEAGLLLKKLPKISGCVTYWEKEIALMCQFCSHYS